MQERGRGGKYARIACRATAQVTSGVFNYSHCLTNSRLTGPSPIPIIRHYSDGGISTLGTRPSMPANRDLNGLLSYPCTPELPLYRHTPCQSRGQRTCFRTWGRRSALPSNRSCSLFARSTEHFQLFRKRRSCEYKFCCSRGL